MSLKGEWEAKGGKYWLKLNVGCGRDSWGDVKLEIDRDYWLHKRQSINFFADARFLPFRDKCFEELRIYHVLEHIQDWKQALSECCRVSRTVSVEVPKEPIILNVWRQGISIRFRKFLKFKKLNLQYWWRLDYLGGYKNPYLYCTN
jgi:hypothetical protein